MKFTFNQSDMMRELQKVMGAVPTRVPMPALSNLHVKLEGKTLELVSTDLEVTVVAKLKLTETEGEGGVLIPAKRFQDLMRELPDVPIEMEVQESLKVELKVEGVGKFDLPGGDPIDFPELPKVDGKLSLKTSGGTVKRMINKTMFAVSKDEMRPILTGFLLQLRPGEFRMVATDGHRLSRVTSRDVVYKGEAKDIVIPMKAFNILVRNLADDDSPIFNFAETRTSFNTGDYTMITRLIDGHYPKYESIIPENNPNKMTVHTSDLMAAVRRVSIFANQISRQIKVSLDSKEMMLETEDQELGGKAEVKVPVDYDGKAMEIAYNANYLMDALKQIDTDEVLFEMGASNDAAVIKPMTQTDSEEFFMLLMPIRLK